MTLKEKINNLTSNSVANTPFEKDSNPIHNFTLIPVRDSVKSSIRGLIDCAVYVFVYTPVSEIIDASIVDSFNTKLKSYDFKRKK